MGGEIDETGAGNDAEDDARFFVDDRRFFRRIFGDDAEAWIGAGVGAGIGCCAAPTNTAPLPPCLAALLFMAATVTAVASTSCRRRRIIASIFKSKNKTKILF